MDDDDEIEGTDQPLYGLVMPFVVCESQGGPFNDDAFVAGYRCGVTDGILAGPHTTSLDAVAREPELKQLDLIAMRRGFVVVSERADEEWFTLRFERLAETPQ